MRIVALEEHILPLAVRNAWSALDLQYQDEGFRIFDKEVAGGIRTSRQMDFLPERGEDTADQEQE